MSKNDQKPSLAALKRLPSLKPPRDINLGQSPAIPNLPGLTSSASSLFAKPKFAPNLALAGKRVSPAVKNDSMSDPKKNGQKIERNRQMSKRSKKEPEIIQSKGTFSEGFAEGAGSSRSVARDRAECSMSSQFSSSSNLLSNGGGGGKKSKGESGGKLSNRGLHGLGPSDDLETDEDFLGCLMKDDFISDLYSGDKTPISVLVKKDEKKLLGPDKCDDNKMEVDIVPESRVKHQDLNIFENLDSDTSSSELSSGKFFLVQLPSVLSNMLLEKDFMSTKNIKKEIKTETTNDNETTPQIIDNINQNEENSNKKCHVLDYFPGGSIAKLQILKSGRMRLKMETETEPIYMNADMSTNTFAQELVQLKVDENNADKQSSQMNVIDDNIRRRILIKPDIEKFSKSLFR
uniref:DNA-directed RNA polymerase III subunit RPC4 n=1 Tax=Romanomermis culicivorax TaxID=13658 RepID=A0A915ITW6_ROMCU